MSVSIFSNLLNISLKSMGIVQCVIKTHIEATEGNDNTPIHYASFLSNIQFRALFSSAKMLLDSNNNEKLVHNQNMYRSIQIHNE